MKVIISTNNQEIFVDDEDYDYLNTFKWSVHKYKTQSYAETGHGGIKMHRLLMKIDDPNIIIDHADRNGLNNQKSNLRLADRSKNAMNKPANGEVKYKGVIIDRTKQRYFHKGTGEYRNADTKEKIRARIKIEGKSINLGCFQSIEDAALAYNDAAIKYHGEFAVLNEVI